MATHLEVFDLKLGMETKPFLVAGSDELGLVADKMLSAVQTVVDALTTGEKSYTVTFEPTMTAYTVHEKGRISISGLPLMKAKPGTALAEIAAVMTGFAVHEIGHTVIGGSKGIIDAVRREWPGKQLPATLANIVEDVVLEKWTVERYAGFADTGFGETIFTPTYRWLAESYPSQTMVWKGSTGEKVNIVGQIARYRDWVVFAEDEVTQDQLRWFTEWESRITSKTTPKEGVELVREALLRIHNSADAPEPEVPEVEEPPVTDGPSGPGGDEPEDDESDDDETEGPTGPGGDSDDEDEDDDEDSEESTGKGKGREVETPSVPNEEDDLFEDDEDDDTEGDDGDEDSDDADSESDGESDEDGEGEGEGTDNSGESNGVKPHYDGAVEDRPELEKGSIDTEGSGGSGGAHAEAGDERMPDNVDEGFDPTEVTPSLDEVAKSDPGMDREINKAIEEERRSVRLEAGIYGRMKVVFK